MQLVSVGDRIRARSLPALALSATTVAMLLTVAAVSLWAISLPSVDLRQMNDLGLASVLPRTAYVAFGLLSLSFWLALRSPSLETRRRLAVVNLLLLIVMVYGLPPILEHETRLTAAWRHAGVIETIARTGHVHTTLDAYFDWPGFFMLGAFVTKVAGLHSAIALAHWAPLAINLFFFPALLTIFRSATSDDRTVWLALWIFYSANWVGQDYFSPQATAFFLYLVVLAVVLRWFVRSDTPQWLRKRLRLPVAEGAADLTRTRAEWELTPAIRAALIAVVVVVMAVIAPMHQLTPFALIVSLAVLVAARRTPARGLPLLALALTGLWIGFMATAYTKGHLNALTSQIGQLEPTLKSNVGARISGSVLHQDVARERLLFTAVIWFAAVLGAVRSLRRGRPYYTSVLLAAAPFLLIVLQPYGGEVLLRTYLFSLPFVSFLAASLVFAAGGQRQLSWPKVVAAAVASAALLIGLVIARNGNERADYFTRGDASAVRELYRIAPPGSLLVAGSWNLPWKFQDYDRYRYVFLGPSQWERIAEQGDSPATAVRTTEGLMRNEPAGRAFLILTRSEAADLELFGYARRGTFARFELALDRSPRFKRVYANGDGRIYVLVPPEAT
jgi:hypothetical protein